jgi:hypothetical protein
MTPLVKARHLIGPIEYFTKEDHFCENANLSILGIYALPNGIVQSQSVAVAIA